MDKRKRSDNKSDVYNFNAPRSPSPRLLNDPDVENSPVLSQDVGHNIDVVWDWNSPQSKKQPRKCQKRLLVQSPKIPLKRHPSANSVQDFERLRDELKSLREDLAVLDHEESMQLSPMDEAEYKSFNTSIRHVPEDEFDDLMDETVNDQLFAFTQQIEEELQRSTPKKTPEFKFKKVSPKLDKYLNDSFDELFTSMDVPLENKLESSNVKTNAVVRTCSGKVEFYRTQSFEIASNNTISEPTKKVCTQVEIEKKRLEALAKLEAKKRLNNNVPSQCSHEEIEQKRLRALAKLEAKRQQEIIERKRQEAIKRLQTKRQQNVSTANTVKSSLAATRLH